MSNADIDLIPAKFSEEGIADSVIREITGSNEKNDAFLQMLLADAGNDKSGSLASSLFEVVASARLWSRAMTNVVDYWLHEERMAIIRDAVLDIQETGTKKVLECVREALRKWINGI